MTLLMAMLASFFTVVELNCENLFDCRHDSLREDTEFLPTSYRHWTHYRYWRKLHRVGQEIMACGETPDGLSVPDLVALVEVENASVLFDLTRRSVLRASRYEYVMTHSPDPRGMDVALLYSPFSFRLLDHHSIRIPPQRGQRPPRDILYAKGQTLADDTLHVFVVHFPSRSGGQHETAAYRKAAAERLMVSVDSIRRLVPDANILIAGDLNDTGKDPSVRMLVRRGMHDMAAEARGTHGAKATYKYRGQWEMIDHILGCGPLAERLADTAVGDFPFLLEPDDRYGGIRPKRTYIGMRYHDGFSDHLPLIARFRTDAL